MPSTFPGAIDSFTDPLSNSPLNSPSHSTLHSDINDAVEKVEQYMGLVKVIPTSVTGGTLSATGTITCSGTATNLSVNGAFTSLYTNYRVVFSLDAASAGGTYATMRMRVGAADNSAANYTNYIQWTSTSSNGIDRNTSGTSWTAFFYSTQGRAQAEFLFTAPQLTKNTTFFATACDVRTSDFIGATSAGVLRDTTAYDGFTLIAPGNINGTVVIYGLRN